MKPGRSYRRSSAKGGATMADKELCKWKKDRIKEEIDQLRDLVREPTWLCRKCARCARDKKLLCKPVPIDPDRSGGC